MRGASYVAIGLLVTTGSHIAVECNQDGPQGVYVGAEERMLDLPLEAFERAIIKTVGVRTTDGEETIASAAKATGTQEEMTSLLMDRISKRRRIDPSTSYVDGQTLYALPKPHNGLVSVASDVPPVLVERATVKAPADLINNAARSLSKHDLRLAPPGSSTSSITSSDTRFDNPPIAKKAFKFDLNKHPDEVEISNSNSKRQRIDSTPRYVGEQALHALSEPQKYIVLVSHSVPMVLAKKLGKRDPTLIMQNAAMILTKHDFRPAPFGLSTRIAASYDSQLRSQPIAQEAAKFNRKVYPNEVNSLSQENRPSLGHGLHMRVGNDKLVPLATANDQSVSKVVKAANTQGHHVHKVNEVNARIIHAAFLEAFDLPFHQNLRETTLMITIIKRQTKMSPGNDRIVKAFTSLVNKQQVPKLKDLLGQDLEKLLKGMLDLQDDLESLREAYYVKLLIMYELFYDFCYVRLDLFDNLVSKVDRTFWILMLSNYKKLPSHD